MIRLARILVQSVGVTDEENWGREAQFITGMCEQLFILNLHGIGQPVVPMAPGDEEFWLDAGFFADVLDSIKGRQDVRITFDDSNQSDYTIALPLLKARNLTARFFVVASYVDQKGYLTQSQIRALLAEGMDVGSHGMNHRKWAGLDDKALNEEIVLARDQLEQVCGNSVTEAACPFGSYDRRVLKKLRDCGFRKVYTSDDGPTSAKSWLQPRNTVERTHDLAKVRQLVSDVPSGTRACWRHVKLALKKWR